MNRIVLSCVLLSLFLSGCSGEITTPQPFFTETPVITATITLIPTETATPTPTEVPTPDSLNLNNYKIVEGNIQEKDIKGNWQEIPVPYEAGFISYVEIHDGKAYGIDTVDRAVVVKNEAGEWVKFDRPVGIAWKNYPTDIYPDLTGFLDEVSADEITRFRRDGEPLPWGIVEEYQPYDGYSFALEYISGYLLGAELYRAGGVDMLAVAFEVPHKYSRQILFLALPADKINPTFSGIKLVPSSGNLEDMERVHLPWPTIAKSLMIQDIRGEPMVYGAGINTCDKPDPQDGCSNSGQIAIEAIRAEVIQSIKNGEAITIKNVLIFPQNVWLNESLIIK